ncbi:DUF5908 family protein [Rubritalea spongiae]|uniref:DUF5908 family protein n=1 Tax=Rubritalea spongiae TaxID=430797 RepID=A0ABW5DZF4_9BACT
MPVEIREVIIRAEVTQSQKPNSFNTAPTLITPEMKRLIRKICTDEIKQAKEIVQRQSGLDRFER